MLMRSFQRPSKIEQKDGWWQQMCQLHFKLTILDKLSIVSILIDYIVKGLVVVLVAFVLFDNSVLVL